MRDLLETLNPNWLDLGGEIVASFVENPFLEADLCQLEQRFGRIPDLAAVVEDLEKAGVIARRGDRICLSATPERYTEMTSWVRGRRGEDETLRQEVVALETLSRLREKLAVSQEEVTSILDMVPVGVVLLDHLGQVLKANSLAERLTRAWSDIGVHLGVPLDQLYKESFETELDGTPPVAVTTRPFEVEGSDTGVVVVIQDITAKRQMAAEAEKLREDFFSMIRHELRKPLLTVERSLAQLGQAEGASPLALARSATDHLGAMIDDMLFLARLERDPLAVEIKDNVSLRFMLAGCDLAFREKATEAGIDFGVTFPDEDVLFDADERRLQQVLGNLLDNAFKFTPVDGRVSFSGIHLEDEVHFQVSDSGPGIPVEERNQIFGKFYQVQSDASRKPGLGLGLAISQEVVHAHGGKIEVGGSEWGGTLMTIRVPIQRRNQT